MRLEDYETLRNVPTYCNLIGQLHTVDNAEEHVETVAVKMLKQTANLEAEEDFMREVEIMSSFHHPNILILIGVCPRGNFLP